ncbi:hypothetical protein WJX82_003172 [Trebouxia sp. C0006]
MAASTVRPLWMSSSIASGRFLFFLRFSKQPKLDQGLSSSTYKAGTLSADSKHLVDFSLERRSKGPGRLDSAPQAERWSAGCCPQSVGRCPEAGGVIEQLLMPQGFL